MIEKIYVYATDVMSGYQEIRDYMLENATEYFDQITPDNSNRKLNFFKDGRQIMKIYIKAQAPFLEITLYGKNDTIVCSGIESTKPNYIYKCEKGISLGAVVTSDNPRTNHRFVLTITKDNRLNTAIIAAENLRINEPENVTGFYTVNSDTEAFSLKKMYMNPNSEQTVLVPALIGDTQDYTTNLFLMPYTEITEAAKLDINGEKYMSNGLWCVKDE